MSTLRTVESPVGAETIIDGRRFINFGGSSYLGLSAMPEIVDAGVAALRTAGSGYQFMREFGIVTPHHCEVEAQIAAFFGAEAGIFLAGGYYFGLAAMAALRGRFSRVFYDEWTHFSLREAIAASGQPRHAFRHIDVADLEVRLKRCLRPKEVPLLVSDGMYSTFGEIAPLDEMLRVMSPYGGLVLVDESHSFGVLGQTGRGVTEGRDPGTTAVVIGGSTGKALGVLGGIIPGSAAQVKAYRDTPVGRGAAGGLPAAAAMCARSLRYLREHPEQLQCLRTNVAYLKSGLRKLGLDVGMSIAPVAAFTAGTSGAMQALQERLMDEGIFLFYSTYIGAAAGVIRCGIFADHTIEHMDWLLEALRRLL